MDMLIAIPSRDRPHTLGKSTLSNIPREYLKQTKMFVPRAEEKLYKNALWNLQFEDVGVIPSDCTDISTERHHIGQWAEAEGWEKFAMLDDDLYQFAARIEPGGTDLRKSTPGDRKEMFDTVAQYLEWYHHMGVSPRYGNQVFDGDWPIVVENKRLLRFLCYRTDTFLSCEHGRVTIAEDFDVTLQLLTRGFKNCNLHQWSQDQSATNLPGGCSTYRTLALHNANIERLHNMWPLFTKLREKENKTPEAIKAGLANRLEVTIQWEKAYDYGRQQQFHDDLKSS